MLKDLLCNCFKTFENDEIKPKKTLEISEIQLNLAPESDNTNHNNDDNHITNHDNNQLDTITIIHGSKTISLPKLDITDYASLQYNKIINPPTIIPNNKINSDNLSNDNLSNDNLSNDKINSDNLSNEIISNNKLNTNPNSKENDDNIDDDFVVL